jgi:anti-anti-sigma factor
LSPALNIGLATSSIEDEVVGSPDSVARRLGEREHMLKIHVKKSGDVAILSLQGRIVRGETAALRKAMSFQTQASAIVLDFGGINTIDAHGLGVMLQLREEAATKGIEFRLVNVTKLVRRILEITRLDSVFEINPKPETLAACCFGLVAPVRQLARCA